MHPDEIVLNEYVDETLGPGERTDVQQHLDACASCRAIVADLITLTRTASALRRDAIEPPLGVWSRIEDAIGGGIAERRDSRFFGSPTGLAAAAVLAVAVAAALFVGGVVAGRHAVSASSSDPEIASLRQEIHDMRQLMTLSLLQQQSASERLNGVTWTSRIDNPGHEVVAALLDTLMHDENVNVRLATIDALKRFGTDDAVRRGAIEALGKQTSPVVQLALIDFVVETDGAASADVLRRLSQDPTADQTVRARAALGLQRVG